MNLGTLLLQNEGGFLSGLLGSTLLIAISMFGVLIILAVIAGLWKTFDKAYQPGWASIIPLVNLYFLLKIAGRPGWWLILYLIPFVNFVIPIIVSLDVAKAFNKDALFGIILLWLLPPVGYILLGFGDAKYSGPAKSFYA